MPQTTVPPMPDRLQQFKDHFGLTKTPVDPGDDGQSLIDFVDSVIRADSGPLAELFDLTLIQIDTTGLSRDQIVGRLIDLLIGNVWGEEEIPVVNSTLEI